MAALPEPTHTLLLLGLAAATVRYGWSALQQRGWTGRVDDGLHALMGLDMACAVTVPGIANPWSLGTVAFTVATCWFAFQALGLAGWAWRPTWPTGDIAGTPSVQPLPTVAGRCAQPSRWQSLHHAVLMSAMVWMLLAMRGPAMSPSMGAMAGHDVTAASASWGALVAAGYCLVTAPAWGLVDARRRRRLAAGWWRRAGAATAHPLMTLSMGVMLLTMR